MMAVGVVMFTLGTLYYNLLEEEEETRGSWCWLDLRQMTLDMATLYTPGDKGYTDYPRADVAG